MENLSIKPIVPATSLRTLAYEALKSAITNMDIYGATGDVRLDERGLSQTLGVSRTPIREALTVLEQEASCATSRAAACSSSRRRSARSSA